MISRHPPMPDGEAFMASVNKVILIGNLGKDPEIRYTQTGKAVTSFSLATSERAGRDGNERTEWHNIVAWDKLAELCGRLVRKGNKVYVEGRLQTREYTDKTGTKKWSTEVVAREMVFLTTDRDGAGRGQSAPSSNSRVVRRPATRRSVTKASSASAPASVITPRISAD